MAWYRVGTVSLTNGNAVVSGSGTQWFSILNQGDAFLGPDGRPYEVLSVQSDTQLTLASPYLGTTAAGQQYAVFPTQSLVRDLTQQVLTLIGQFGSVVSSAGAGRFSDGSAATPGVSFSSDPDTGIQRPAANTLAVVTGGVERWRTDALGRIAVGMTNPQTGMSFAPSMTLSWGSTNYPYIQGDQPSGFLAFGTQGTERVRIDSNGFIGINTSTPTTTLEVVGPQINLRRFSPDSQPLYIAILKGRGTSSLPDPVSINDGLGEIQFFGRDGTTDRLSAAVGAGADAAPANGTTPGFIAFRTAPPGVNQSPQERVRIDSLGNLIASVPAAVPTLLANRQMVFNLTSDTNLRVTVRGSDGVVRSANLTLAP